MITVTINGTSVHTEPTKTIIEAAFENGIYIPHFCWHPALSISGNCRICLVEVEKMPKQVIACSTYCADGMVVHVDSEKAVKAREAVMEFILINHPLDCPICDEAGECKLQDYAYQYSVGTSRFDEEKNRKRKRSPLGPNVMFDAERCISCSRCIRFCADIVGDPQLTFVERGDRVTIETFPGRQLDTPYAMNVIEICPVGALTSVDFRFAARAWDMASTPSVCPGCARGCNVNVWTKQNRILRVTPRENQAVNDFWMCDRGRLESWRHAQADTRIARPLVREGDAQVEAEWPVALERAAALLRAADAGTVAVIGSAFDTCEDNAALRRLASEVLHAEAVGVFPHSIPGDGDSFLLCEDKTPNMRGARMAGFPTVDDAGALERLASDLAAGTYRTVVLADARLAEHPDLREALLRVPALIVLVSNHSVLSRHAAVTLPATVFAENYGTMINVDGHLQLLRPAMVTMERERWTGDHAMSRLDRFGTAYDRWGISERMHARPVWEIATQLAAALGAAWGFAHPEDVFTHLAAATSDLRGIGYDALAPRGIRLGPPPPPRRSYTYSEVHH
jgi:NADH-quinone oxidoreductase subunit G